ncbi:MAG: hypothetical protein M3464_04245 [Chloroflexota bacterium]|nr:hypothetical protein [Chloroflexota bacterium]
MGSVAVLVGAAAGAFIGGVIARFEIQPFIVTLATLLAGRGLALWLADNSVARLALEAFTNGFIELNYLRLVEWSVERGDQSYGLVVTLPVAVVVVAYVISGALAGLAGLAGAILAAQAFSGNPNEAIGWELSAIAAVVVGGTLLTGGLGSVGTTLVGVLLLGVIINLLELANLNPYWQQAIRGLFLLVVVVLESRLVGFGRRRSPAP